MILSAPGAYASPAMQGVLLFQWLLSAWPRRFCGADAVCGTRLFYRLPVAAFRNVRGRAETSAVFRNQQSNA
jgi:hypothetical protein